MQKFSAVVYTTGRTGSYLIVSHLCRRHRVDIQSDLDRSIVDGIVHTHNPLYIPTTDNFVAVIGRRRNLFDAILSMELTKQTNEFVAYTNKKITPYAIDITKFKNCYFYQKAFYQTINRTNYRKTIDVDYEDLISDPDCLLADLGVKINLSLSQKSPYDYYKLITNIDELAEEYQKLEQIPITIEDLEQFKDSVQADLEDIRVNHKGNRP